MVTGVYIVYLFFCLQYSTISTDKVVEVKHDNESISSPAILNPVECLPLQKADSTHYKEIRFPMMSDMETRAPLLYFNDEWIEGADLNLIDDPEKVLTMDIKNNEYGQPSIFIQVPPEVLTEIRAKAEELREIYEIETEPICEFPGGNGELVKWIQENRRVPVTVRGMDKVEVGFTILPDGSVKNGRILRSGKSEAANVEALRLVNELPKFRVKYLKPGREPIFLRMTIKFPEPGQIWIR